MKIYINTGDAIFDLSSTAISHEILRTRYEDGSRLYFERTSEISWSYKFKDQNAAKEIYEEIWFYINSALDNRHDIVLLELAALIVQKGGVKG